MAEGPQSAAPLAPGRLAMRLPWRTSVLRRLALLRRFRGDERGSTLIEFAMITMALVMLLGGIVEFSMIMLAKNSMEAATNISSRLGKTGFTDDGLSREDTILAEVERRTGAIIDPELLEISSKAYDQFDQIGKPEPWNDANEDGFPDPGEYTDINGNGQYDEDMGVAGVGGSDDVVVYTVSYPWRVFTPLVGQFFGSDSTVNLTASSVVKNEPF